MTNSTVCNNVRLTEDEFDLVGGPSLEWSDGDKVWCQHGNIHRADGPTLEWPDGDKGWDIHKTPRVDTT
tara:strand:- start:532 stop:738 length:207 start_codon:yes stop_codon:yes gene_type:complete